MIRFIFRVLAGLVLAGAVVMAALDATRSVAASSLVMTPLAQSWESAFPDGFATVRTFVTNTFGAFLWDPVSLAILDLPGWFVLAVVALALYALGRRREPRREDWA